MGEMTASGWTIPDWSFYTDEALESLRTHYTDAIKRNEGNSSATDEMEYWHLVIQSINETLTFRKQQGATAHGS